MRMMKRRKHSRAMEAGFTLIELVIVMAIIAMLVALIAPRFVGTLGDSQVKATRAQIQMMSTALDSFRVDNRRYPTQQEGLKALIDRPEGVPTWAGPYLSRRALPSDAWGKEFVYQIPPARGGLEYDLFSLGADGAGEKTIIGNWQ